MTETKALAEKIMGNMERAIIGKRDEMRLVLAAFFAGGHVLLEDVPGTGKTALAKALAMSFDLSFSRVQFTPDLLPSELTGINFYSPKTGDFTFRRGSLFANVVLADEINRATPRTQSGLLESMEERQVSVDGATHQLERPYFVIATQNPVETQGTFPLPEAQLDRFMVQLGLGYPTAAETARAIRDNAGAPAQGARRAVCGREELDAAFRSVAGVFMHDEVLLYIARLAEATRENPSVQLGVSTRGAIALARLCRARAALEGRGFITPDDARFLLPYAFSHRIMLRGGLHGRGAKARALLEEVAESVAAPVEDWKGAS